MIRLSARTIRTWLAWGVVAGILLLAGAMLLGYHRGYRLLSVQSDSMRPFVSKGGAVVVDCHELHVAAGDVVSYRSPIDARTINTHRVMAVDLEHGLMTTKGDNTQLQDTAVPLRNVIGVVQYSLPLVGLLLDAVKRPVGLVALVYVPALLLVMHELWLLRSYYRTPPRHYALHH